MDNDGGWKREPLEQSAKRAPKKEATPSPARQLVLPDAHHSCPESLEGQAITGDPLVRRVAAQFLTQCPMLIADRVVPMQPTALRNCHRVKEGRLPADAGLVDSCPRVDMALGPRFSRSKFGAIQEVVAKSLEPFQGSEFDSRFIETVKNANAPAYPPTVLPANETSMSGALGPLP